MKKFARYTWLLAALAIVSILYRSYHQRVQPPSSHWSVDGIALGVSQSTAGNALPNHVSRTIPIDDDRYFTSICEAPGACAAFADAAAISVIGHSLEFKGERLLKQGDTRELVLQSLGPPDVVEKDILIYLKSDEVQVGLADGKLEWVQLSAVPIQSRDLHWIAHHHFSSQPKFDPERTLMIVETNYPAQDLRTTGISHEGELLITCGGAKATPREQVHQILGAPRRAAATESIWMYRNITADVNRDWKPHAKMEVLVVRFDGNGLAKEIETDFNTLMKLEEELKSDSKPGE